MPRAKVLLLGDSLRVACQFRVRELLEVDGMDVVWPGASTGDAGSLSEMVEALIGAHQPDMACFSAGLAARELYGEFARAGEPTSATLETYEQGVLRVAESLRRFCGRQVVFVGALHVHEARFGLTIDDPEVTELGRRLNRRIDQFNRVAFEVLGRVNVMSTGLERRVGAHLDEAIGADGVSLSVAGVERVAGALADGVYSVV